MSTGRKTKEHLSFEDYKTAVLRRLHTASIEGGDSDYKIAATEMIQEESDYLNICIGTPYNNGYTVSDAFWSTLYCTQEAWNEDYCIRKQNELRRKY